MKKTIYFSLVAFLMILGVAKTDIASAQTVPMESSEKYDIPLICNGQEVDRLKGVVDIFCRMHYEAGKIVWMIHNFDAILTSNSGEVFEFKGVRKIDSVEREYSIHANIKGDRGSHYILFYTVTMGPPPVLTVEKAICPGNDN
jgi:hypothetical protein